MTLLVEGCSGLASGLGGSCSSCSRSRATLITAISIPLSLLIAMIGVQLSDYCSTSSLAGPTVAVGRVVDDSIVVVREHQAPRPGIAPPAHDVLGSVKKWPARSRRLDSDNGDGVRAAWPSSVGEWSVSFSLAVCHHGRCVALGASLLVSMTIVPVAGVLVSCAAERVVGQLAAAPARSPVRRKPDESHTAEETKVTRLQRGYLPIPGFGLTHPLITLGIALLVFVATLGSATFLKTRLHRLGHRPKRTLAIQRKLPPGTRLSTTSAAPLSRSRTCSVATRR